MSPAARRNRFIGAHTINNGGVHMAVRRAARGGMTAVQVFTAVPKYYNDKMSVRPERAQRFRKEVAASNIDPKMILVHAPYVLSVATPDPKKWARASGGLTKELERSSDLGAGSVCFHPGSAGNDTPANAAKRIAQAITTALSTVKSDTRLLVENTAGAGRTMGRTAAEIGEILSHVPKSLRARTGYGLDTCHLFCSGYDIRRSPAAFTSILDEFEDATGEPPSFFHLNDSAGELGSNRDRHVLIGEGEIGTDPFKWLLADARSAGIPLVLETPQQNYDVTDDDDSPDPYDVRMMKLLSSL